MIIFLSALTDLQSNWTPVQFQNEQLNQNPPARAPPRTITRHQSPAHALIGYNRKFFGVNYAPPTRIRLAAMQAFFLISDFFLL
jgi:hypothetical protein